MTVATPRQARSEETLRRILAACDTLLAERPFEQISMQDIAREAGVSVGNLYNRFSDKDGLVNHVFAGHQQRARALFAEALAGQPSGLDTKARLEAIVALSRSAIADLRPLFASMAARMAQGLAPPTALRSNSEELIDSTTDWLLEGDPALDRDRCRFAVASILFGLQFNLLFGSADRLVGDTYDQQLAHQAHCYLTCNHD